LSFGDFRAQRRDSATERPGLCRQMLTSALLPHFGTEFLENRRRIPDIQA
jgi:hypothetical protein